MKKFLLIPTTLVTALLTVAFVSPAAASSAVRAVAPAARERPGRALAVPRNLHRDRAPRARALLYVRHEQVGVD